MNILVLGYGAKPGSWAIRGQQLGAAIGARVTSTPTLKDWRWAELVVIVKRSEPRFGPEARARGVPMVWDALDFWRQPADNAVSEATARQLLAHTLTVIRPALTIGATQAQADAADGAYLPHHSWPGLVPTPARVDVQTVGYQGNPVYLGRWKPAIEAECRARNWVFVVNPPHLAAMDILVALRDEPFDGWMCREWKSGVKLVNAIAAGRPVIAQDSAAWRELQPPGSVVDSIAQLSDTFDHWVSSEGRDVAAVQCLAMAPMFRVDTIGRRYLELLAGVARVEVAS